MSFLPIVINIPNRFVPFVCSLIILCHASCEAFMVPNQPLENNPCTTCRKISDKFIEVFKRTANSNFGGGNTDWEEKKLKGYAKSETRLIEIMENLCARTESQCSSFLEKYEESIEQWYQQSTSESIDEFHQWLCIDTAKVCCPEGTFGQNCRRCHYGDNKLVCSGNGACDGDGTRSGNGRCSCFTKYSGTTCSNCQNGYTKSVNDNKQVICTDIDECQANLFISPCGFHKCNNTEGGYECYGDPFYRDVPKLTTLATLFLTASILLYKEMHGLVSLTCTVTFILIILYARNIL